MKDQVLHTGLVIVNCKTTNVFCPDQYFPDDLINHIFHVPHENHGQLGTGGAPFRDRSIGRIGKKYDPNTLICSLSLSKFED
jgi:hypothetical protein